MTEIKTSNGGKGQVHIADDVIAIIAGTAALEVEGVGTTTAGNFEDFVGMFGKGNLARGVKLNIEGENVSIEINIHVKFGYKIQEISKEVQKKVTNAIETMTGFNVVNVDVNVIAVNFDKDKNKEIDN